jgi:hypothetical protein
MLNPSKIFYIKNTNARIPIRNFTSNLNYVNSQWQGWSIKELSQYNNIGGYILYKSWDRYFYLIMVSSTYF